MIINSNEERKQFMKSKNFSQTIPKVNKAYVKSLELLNKS